MSGVLGVLDDHPQHQPAQRVAAVAIDGASLDEARRLIDDATRAHAFTAPHLESLQRITVKGFEVLVRVVVAVIQQGQLEPGKMDGEPPSLDTGEVSRQAVQAHGRRW